MKKAPKMAQKGLKKVKKTILKLEKSFFKAKFINIRT